MAAIKDTAPAERCYYDAPVVFAYFNSKTAEQFHGKMRSYWKTGIQFESATPVTVGAKIYVRVHEFPPDTSCPIHCGCQRTSVLAEVEACGMTEEGAIPLYTVTTRFDAPHYF